MDKTNKIRDEIKKLYSQNPEERIKVFFDLHVDVVAKYAKKIAEENGADSEICVLAALFHDIARTWGILEEPDLMNESLKKAQELMKKNGYGQEKITKVKEAILYHSCRDRLPKTEEGKVLATADAMAHLMTDIYLIFVFNRWVFNRNNIDDYRKWVLEKLERDFNRKIFYEEYRKKAETRYNALKEVFGGGKVNE